MTVVCTRSFIMTGSWSVHYYLLAMSSLPQTAWSEHDIGVALGGRSWVRFGQVHKSSLFDHMLSRADWAFGFAHLFQ